MNITPKQLGQFFGGLILLAIGSALVIRTFLIEEFMWFGLGTVFAIVGAIILEDVV